MKAPSLAGAAFLVLLTGGAAWSQAAAPAEQAVTQARAYSYQIREGRYDLAPKALALVETAAKAQPADGRLWTLVGVAEFQMMTAAQQPGAPRADLAAAAERSAAAYDKALAINPNNAQALAGRGAARIVLGLTQGKFDRVMAAVADMDGAVKLAPDDHPVRLQRAFFGVNLPPPVRNTASVEEDMTYLLRLSEGQRAGDVLHLLLGDLYAETGRAAEAKTHYQASNRPASTTGAQATARLAALAGAGVPAAEMTSLRSQLGSNCAMCHAR